MTQLERIRALADPRTGTYLNKETFRYECRAAVEGDKYIVVGWYDARYKLLDKAEDAVRAIEKRIWDGFIHPTKEEKVV